MKTTCIISLMLISFGITAQESKTFGFKKNDIVLSGSLRYFTNNTDNRGENSTSNSEVRNFSIVPEIGYFINNHIATGIKVGYVSMNYRSIDKQRSEDNFFVSENKGQGYTIGLFGRYYFSPKKRVSFFGEINATYENTSSELKRNNQSTTQLDFSFENDRETYGISASPGVNVFINKRFSLTSRIGRIGYSTNKGTSENIEEGSIFEEENSNFSIDVGLDNFFFGILYRI